jgi:hypothetical protein
MGTVLLLDALYAAGIALSPTPVVVVILILFSTTKRRIALAYLIGWIIGLFLLGLVILALTKTGLDLVESRTRVARPLADLVIGIILMGLGLVEWRRRPKGDAKPAEPGILKRMDELLSSSQALTPFRALGLAIVMSVASPKNIALMIAAGLAIRRADVAVSDMALLLVVFVLIASITVGIPVIYAIVAGERAAEQLTRSKAWLLENNARVVAVMLFVIGLFLIVKATGELTGIG